MRGDERVRWVRGMRCRVRQRGSSASRAVREAASYIRPLLVPALLDQVFVREGYVRFWGAGVAASGGGGGPDHGVAVLMHLPESRGFWIVVEVAGGEEVLLAGTSHRVAGLWWLACA